jgi:hypothetical protein
MRSNFMHLMPAFVFAAMAHCPRLKPSFSESLVAALIDALIYCEHTRNIDRERQRSLQWIVQEAS